MKPVLFVCVHNSGCSQMAEGFFNHLARGRARAISAGTMPADRVQPEVVQAMGVEGMCPATFMPTEEWGSDDPQGQPIEKVREIRDEIGRRVEALLVERK